MIAEMVGGVMFAGAAGTAGMTIWTSVAPQWRRIVQLAAGIPDESFSPLSQLVRAERQIAVRRWSRPMPAPLARLREAA